MSIRVVLIDDHALFREGLRAALASNRHIEVVAEASTARDALATVNRVAFDLAIVDVMLPDQSGLAVVRELRRLFPACKILVLSMVESPYTVAELLRAGAAGYALKSQATPQIAEAIQAVTQQGRYLAPSLPRQDIDALVDGKISGPLDRLSPREREVFDLLIRGWSNERVATALSIAPRTAETHRQNIMDKLDVHSAVELLRMAARHGLLSDHHD